MSDSIGFASTLRLGGGRRPFSQQEREDMGYNTLNVKFEKVTPQIAEKWLNENGNNRQLKPGVAEKYADDMAAGNWTLCTAPIAFYDDGVLADGQHRLFAVVESRTPQDFVILRGLKREDGLNIDTGATRTLVDNARIAGRAEHLTNELLAITRAIASGSRGKEALSAARRLEIVEEHREAAEFAMQHGPRGRYLRNACILAAIGRAWYHIADKARLAEFGSVVTSGLADKRENLAAITLRNYLTGSSTAAGAGEWEDTFRKTQQAIAYFMERAPLRVIKTAREEPYPLRGAGKPWTRGRVRLRETSGPPSSYRSSGTRTAIR